MSTDDTTETPATTEVKFEGETYTVPKSADEWPLRATKSLEEGKWASFLLQLLPPRQAAKLEARNPASKDAARLVTAIMEQAYGVTSGE